MNERRTDAEVLLSRLCKGNQAWASGKALASTVATSREPSPVAVAVICSDLEHAPESVFGLRSGELVVAQAPGPFIGESVSSAIEYGVHTLGLRLVILMTHELCPLFDARAAGPAALPTTTVGRLVFGTVRRARSCCEHVARVCAREQAARMLTRVQLPRDLTFAAAVLLQTGYLELL